MVKGHNKADPFQKLVWICESKSVKERPCVFLSHKKEDKAECRRIAEYLKSAEIDYYLDELDASLQEAAFSEDPNGITESIKKGIRESSHMLVVISEKTYKSHWIPFEVGYGHAAIFDKNLGEDRKIDKLRLSILTLKDISEKTLPDFMQVGNIISGIKSLNKYLSDITGLHAKSLEDSNRLVSYYRINHPLDDILNWRL